MQAVYVTPTNVMIVAQLLLLLFHTTLVVEGNPTDKGLQKRPANVSFSSSPWLKKVTNSRATGCWNRPWICNPPGEFPPKSKNRCCRNRCVDVSSDVENCGWCGIRCPFTWQCCRGLCINTNINPFHCGRCEHRCPFPSFCFYGMCGYAQPLPPFPFPLPPRPPFPFPFPPKPPKPHPPMPPKPHPPKPFPPKPFPPKPYPPRGPHPPNNLLH